MAVRGTLDDQLAALGICVESLHARGLRRYEVAGELQVAEVGLEARGLGMFLRVRGHRDFEVPDGLETGHEVRGIREAVGPGQYGLTVARVAAITYGKQPDEPSLVISGIGRAEAMAYRDARGQAMTDQDWSEVERRLRRAYQSLKALVGAD